MVFEKLGVSQGMWCSLKDGVDGKSPVKPPWPPGMAGHREQEWRGTHGYLESRRQSRVWGDKWLEFSGQGHARRENSRLADSPPWEWRQTDWCMGLRKPTKAGKRPLKRLVVVEPSTQSKEGTYFASHTGMLQNSWYWGEFSGLDPRVENITNKVNFTMSGIHWKISRQINNQENMTHNKEKIQSI